MPSEEIHNFFRPWFYTTLDLVGKSQKPGSNTTGAAAIDDLFLSTDILQRDPGTFPGYQEKVNSLMSLFSVYLQNAEKYSSITPFDNMHENEKILYTDIMEFLTVQRTIFTELTSLFKNQNSQLTDIRPKIEKLVETVIDLGYKTLLCYLSWRHRNIISQCDYCHFINENNSIYCISCGKVFSLDQDEIMTEMILNLSIYQEHKYEAQSLFTTNKISDLFFKYLSFTNNAITWEMLIRDMDIMEVILNKTKIKIEKTLYTANRLYIDIPNIEYGWSFIEGLDKISSKFNTIRNDIQIEEKINNALKLWSEIIWGIRKINESISFYDHLEK